MLNTCVYLYARAHVYQREHLYLFISLCVGAGAMCSFNNARPREYASCLHAQWWSPCLVLTQYNLRPISHACLKHCNNCFLFPTMYLYCTGTSTGTYLSRVYRYTGTGTYLYYTSIYYISLYRKIYIWMYPYFTYTYLYIPVQFVV